MKHVTAIGWWGTVAHHWRVGNPVARAQNTSHTTFHHRPRSLLPTFAFPDNSLPRRFLSTAKARYYNGFLQGTSQVGQGDPCSRTNRLPWWCHPGARRVHGRSDPIHHPKRQGTRP